MSTVWMACAALVLGATGPRAEDVAYINLQRFTIPIKIMPEKQHEVRALILYMSPDQGQTWREYATAAPDKKGFDFSAAGDGLFFFKIAVIDRSGRQDPVDINRAPVNMKVFVDTKKPEILLAAARSDNEVTVTWTIHEERPKRETVKLEYKVGDSPGGQWTPLPIELSERGNHRFTPGMPGPVTVRLSLSDLAENQAVEEKVVPAGTGAAPMPRTDTSISRTGNVEPVPPVNNPAPTPENRPAGPVGGQAALAVGGSPPPPPVTPSPAQTQTTSYPSSAVTPTRGQLPGSQIVNKRQVTLGFNVAKFGPSGLGSVEVYMTTDEGTTWEKMPGEPKVTLPPTAPRGGQPVTGSVTVNIPKDGVVYGFSLVVKSRAGLGKSPPAPGDAPQVRVEVDTTQPEAELYEPKPEQTRQDSLVLAWKANDRNLATNPITLEWAPRPEGPWTFIGEPQMANTGNYTWQVAQNTPAQVYLRLTVRDTAGNVAVAQTTQPQLIDTSRPESTDVHVVPTPVATR